MLMKGTFRKHLKAGGVRSQPYEKRVGVFSLTPDFCPGPLRRGKGLEKEFNH